MFRAIWSPLAREDGQVVFVFGAFAEILLMVLLGLSLTLGRLVLDRVRADEALLMASQSACRQIALPVGPSGPAIDEASALQIFQSVLDNNLAGQGPVSQESTFRVVAPGSDDAKTGYVFGSEGVETSLRFSDTFMGEPLTEVLYMDAEVHHDLS